jgi:RNA polymerase sigma-70 factor, ECF subfamily
MERMTSFQQLYSEHFRFVWRCLRRLGVRESDVADATQDVFLVVHRRLAEWEGRAQMRTWLFRICMNVASDRRRLASARREIATESVQEQADDAQDCAQRIEQTERMALLEAVLGELPLQQRAVLTLFELEEIGCEQIAQMLEIPLGTVYSRLRLARQGFRDALRRRVARERFQVGVPGDEP